MRPARMSILLLTTVFLTMGFGLAQANNLAIRVKLDKNTLKAIPQYLAGPTWEKARIYMEIENISPRQETIKLSEQYHFWLIKTSQCNECTRVTPTKDGLPVVAEGFLKSVYGKKNSTITIEPHTVLVEAFGEILSSVDTRHTYKGYLLPGTYLLKAEIPEGAIGSKSSATTETLLNVRYESDL